MPAMVSFDVMLALVRPTPRSSKRATCVVEGSPEVVQLLLVLQVLLLLPSHSFSTAWSGRRR
jgi:hypothetical protein